MRTSRWPCSSATSRGCVGGGRLGRRPGRRRAVDAAGEALDDLGDAAGDVIDQSWFLEHRFHQNGLALGNLVPFNATYVVPFSSIDPRSIRTAPWQRAPGLAQPREIVSPLRRQALWRHRTVRFVALEPRPARDLARWRARWRDAELHLRGVAPHLADLSPRAGGSSASGTRTPLQPGCGLQPRTATPAPGAAARSADGGADVADLNADLRAARRRRA